MAKLVDTSRPYVFSGGQEYALKSVSLKLLEAFDHNHISPKPPTKEVPIAGGGTEEVDDYDNPEHIIAMSEFNERATTDFMALICGIGIDVTLPSDNKWVKRLQATGIALDMDFLELPYVQFMCMVNFQEDFRNVSEIVLRLSGVSEEAINEWVSMFRREMDGGASS